MANIVYLYDTLTASSRLCGAVLQAWHIYIETRRTKKELYKKALEVYGSNLVRYCENYLSLFMYIFYTFFLYVHVFSNVLGRAD